MALITSPEDGIISLKMMITKKNGSILTAYLDYP